MTVALIAAQRFAVVPALALAAFAFALGCSPRVSYSVQTLHADPKFTGRMLSGADIVLLPVLSDAGVLLIEGLEADVMAESLRKRRPDLSFIPYDRFEDNFPARFDRNHIAEFRRAIFREEILKVKAMDDVWGRVAQPYVMAFSLADGASIRNMDESSFKHVSVKCELWSRADREVVWRSSCRGVSDDAGVSDARLIMECVRRLAEAIPGVVPNYGLEDW